MTKPKNKLVRDAAGRLVEVADDTPALAPQSQPAAAQSPVTPAASAAAGASPQQAAMAGTPAQKGPVLAQSVAQAATVEGQARLTPQTAPQAPAATALTAERMQALGSYGTRLQALITQRTQAVTQQAAAPTVNADALKALMTGKTDAELASATTALTKYLSGGRSEADLAALAGVTGLERLTADQAGGLVQGAPEALAGAASAAQGAVTVGQLNLAEAGIDANQLAQDLGVPPEQLAQLTPDELQARVRAKVDTGFSDTAALRAEYVSASPQRREQIMADLRARGESGATGVELSVADLADRMESAEQVQFAGQSRNIQQLLSDETISDTIRQAATNPAALKQLEATEPGLAAWISQNRASLETLSHDINQQVLQLGRTQESYAGLTADLSAPLQAALGIARSPDAGPITSAELEGLQRQLTDSPLYQALKGNTAVAALLQSKPAAAELLKGMTREAIEQAVTFDAAARQDPDLMQLAGLDPNAAVLIPTAESVRAQGLLAQLPPAAKAAPAFRLAMDNKLMSPDVLAEYAGQPQLFENPTLTALLQDGTVDTAAELRLIASKPGILDTIAAHRSVQAKVERAASGAAPAAELRDMLFGGGTADEVASRLTEGIRKSLPQSFWDYHEDGRGDRPANYDALVAKSREAAARYDTDGDGRLSAADFGDEGLRKIAGRLKSPLTDNELLAGKTDQRFDVFANTARELLGAGKLVVDAKAAQVQANKDTQQQLLAAGWQVDPATGTLKPPVVAGPQNTAEQQAAVDDVAARGRAAAVRTRMAKALGELEQAQANYKRVYQSVRDMKGSINEAEMQTQLAAAQAQIDAAQSRVNAVKRDQ